VTILIQNGKRSEGLIPQEEEKYMIGAGLDYTLCQRENGVQFLATADTILLFTASRPDLGKT
jgi:hypothetical protein